MALLVSLSRVVRLALLRFAAPGGVATCRCRSAGRRLEALRGIMLCGLWDSSSSYRALELVWHCQTAEIQHRRLMLLSRLATTSARTLVRPRAAPLASFLPHGSSQTVRSTTALIDPAVLSRDDSSKAGPALHAAGNLDALLHGTTKKPNAQNEFTETAVADAPQLHGRYASIAAPRAQTIPQPEFSEVEAADHAWRQTNHIWSNDELEKVSVEQHEPVTVSDHCMKGVMNVLYHGFNFVTGYDPVDPSPRSVAWRLIILESFAGVPGFVAAGFRHCFSLRSPKREHSAIYSFSGAASSCVEIKFTARSS